METMQAEREKNELKIKICCILVICIISLFLYFLADPVVNKNPITYYDLELNLYFYCFCGTNSNF